MIRVKICGLTEVGPALAAAEAGADYLGLVFAPGRHRVTPEKSLEIIGSFQGRKHRPPLVGVFVNRPAREVNSLAENLHLDRVQISGDEPWEYCLDIRPPVIKTIHVFPGCDPGEIMREIEKGYRVLAGKDLIVLLDTRTGNAYGGTGQVFDWQVARVVSSSFPVIVAGGLTPDNVHRLIATACPWGVDVSSGVESRGQKDIRKIREFIQKVKVNHASDHEK